ncbi:uncharacterized protein LOC112574757 isoform X2 [Pomacea canaliculata]|uniref:uncharacterized protein LOC112574757 isoform X2 n=1 Tax=Pomacea canaliculata TaxID=400727 RepID=UPI000D7278C3|nr:uncharacterized protein LOC112574757 isoform X2 [Pomacea canaliculata]
MPSFLITKYSHGLAYIMKLFIFLSLLVADVLARESISCKIPAVEPMAATSLTCSFPVDLSVAKIDFSVHHANGTGKAVLDCLWVKGKLECFDAPGYIFNRNVSNQLTIYIQHAFPNLTGEYYCKLSDSTNYDIQHCQLTLKTETTNKASLAIGLGCAFAAVAVVIIVLVIFFRKKLFRRRLFMRPKSEVEVHEEEQPMVSSKNKNANVKKKISEKEKEITKEFQDFLENSILKMYPNMLNGCYFVPPIYFNKTRYKKQFVADQVVYVPEKSEQREVRHDLAVQQVMSCLNHLTQHRKEEMFVLTQFQYSDYLSSPGDKYEKHSLPVPEEEDDSVGSFDFLIVHRQYGVLVGVVKAVQEEDVENSKHELQRNDISIIEEVQEAVKQLIKANDTIRHLMGDHENFPKVRQTLILPNLSRNSLQRALKDHHDIAVELRQCLEVDAVKDPTELCVCSEHLPHCSKPVHFNKGFVTYIRQCWKWTTSNDVRWNDTLHRSMISRFFGPATQSTLKVSEDYERFMLPKTLAEAVSLTGDLYSRSVLQQDIIKQFHDKHTVFLTGPPNTGKTRILTLAGATCLSRGQNVFVVKDTSSPYDPFLSQHLKSLNMPPNNQPTSNALGEVYEEACNFESEKSVKECVERIANTSLKENQTICVLLDIGHLKGKRAKMFCETLSHKVVGDHLRLWVSCTGDSCPTQGFRWTCNEIVNCPPAVVREVVKYKENTKAKNTNIILPPTDGPPVKYIYYKTSLRDEPHGSLKCGQGVGSFLVTELLITGNESASQSAQKAQLRFKDVLIIFGKDCSIEENSGFLMGLRDKGISVHAAKREENTVVVKDDSDSAWAMSVSCMETYRVKRKVVVYVEYYSLFKTGGETRDRAVTSCTSQLILVQPTVAVTALLATETQHHS